MQQSLLTLDLTIERSSSTY